MPPVADTDPELVAALQRMGLAGPRDACLFTPLSGGVSSDIFRVEVAGRSFFIKRALAKLKVAADWRAPVARNHSEAEWPPTWRNCSLPPAAVPGVSTS